MKKILSFLILLIFILIPSSNSHGYPKERLQALFFYSSNCFECFDIKERVLPPIKERYKEEIEWKELNIDEDPENLRLLHSVASQFEKKGALKPSVLIGDIFLVGSREIEERLEESIQSSLKKKPLSTVSAVADLLSLLEVFSNFSIFTIITSGLVDGINPCAFAVIVFFISFLTLYGYGKREIICVGVFYCLAVFITYILIGLGLFKFLYALSGFYVFVKYFYYFVAIFCFLLAGLALYDYLKFQKTKEAGELILQLPKFLKDKIHAFIGFGLREKREILGLAVASFVVGFLVSLLEAACTGQIYLPTIVFILKNTDLKVRALTYILLYNLMFILPLLAIFSLFLLGFGYNRYNRFLKNNLGRIKILMSLVFLVLGVLILLTK